MSLSFSLLTVKIIHMLRGTFGNILVCSGFKISKENGKTHSKKLAVTFNDTYGMIKLYVPDNKYMFLFTFFLKKPTKLNYNAKVNQ